MIPDLDKEPVLLYVPVGPVRTMIETAAKASGVRTYMAECVTDMIVYPAYLCIVDPTFCTHAQWRELTSCTAEMNEAYPKYLLTSASPYLEELPNNNRLETPDRLAVGVLQTIILAEYSKVVFQRCEVGTQQIMPP
jgi:hypothetical protein